MCPRCSQRWASCVLSTPERALPLPTALWISSKDFGRGCAAPRGGGVVGSSLKLARLCLPLLQEHFWLHCRQKSSYLILCIYDWVKLSSCYQALNWKASFCVQWVNTLWLCFQDSRKTRLEKQYKSFHTGNNYLHLNSVILICTKLT